MYRSFIMAGVAALLLSAGPTFADSTGTITSSTSTAAQGNAEAVIMGSSGDTHFSGGYATVPGLGTELISPTAPCSDAYSGQGVGVGFGFGISGSHTNSQCQLEEAARSEYNMGQRQTAVNMMCTVYEVRFTRAVDGDPCPVAYNKSSDPDVILNAKRLPNLPQEAPVASIGYGVPVQTPGQPTASAVTPTHAIPSWCYNAPASTNQADKTAFNYYCKPQ